MPLSITTLNNEAGVGKTYAEIAKDRVSAEWLNTSESTATLDSRIVVKQQLVGKSKSGVPIRRSLVQAKLIAPTSMVIGGNTVSVNEEITVNFTITSPTGLSVLTIQQRRDLVFYLKNFLVGANVDSLCQGMV